MPYRKALQLRVRMDHGIGGALIPIFSGGSSEYVPIPEEQKTRDPRTYATLLAGTAPHKTPAACPPHPYDLLVLYAGLAPSPPHDAPCLFVIGYLRVKEIHRLGGRDIRADRGLQQQFGRTPHLLAANDGGSPRVVALARVNRIRVTDGHPRAFAPLFWHFSECALELANEIARLNSLRSSPSSVTSDTSAIRRLVSSLSTRHRIGFHLASDKTESSRILSRSLTSAIAPASDAFDRAEEPLVR